MHPAINLILSHQSPGAVARMIAYWNGFVPNETILLAYGGRETEFARIAHPWKFFVSDPRLRTRDHQREYQSYTKIFRGAAEALQESGNAYEFVYFAEYDHLPLVVDLNQRQLERLRAESADLLGFHVQRVDETNHPHFLYHLGNPGVLQHWRAITRRDDPEVILSMFGSGSFWRREAFEATANATEPFPVYMEIYLPTIAHHLGFRVRDFGEQDRWVRSLGDRTREIERARKAGAWTLHPVKKLWGN